VSPRTPTLPPTEPAMWRKLLAATHPDRAGDHELFIWTMSLREAVCNGNGTGSGLRHEQPREGSPPRGSTSSSASETLPFDTAADFDGLTAWAIIFAKDVEPLYGSLLKLLKDCGDSFIGPLYDQQFRGASYKQLAAIAHAAGMSKDQRIGWYRVAEGIPLSMRHAGHILSRLKGAE
jgi:hypothetical protein